MNILITGAGGFIAGHLCKQLINEGHNVCAVDIKKKSNWYQWHHHENLSNHDRVDMRLKDNCYSYTKNIDRVYNLACNMGGMGFIQNNHGLCLESVLIQTHLVMACRDNNVRDILYSSSACIYPQEIQSDIRDAASQGLKEHTAYPANPEDGYGWEKLFSEIITQYFEQDYGLNPRICRYHNVYGPHGTYDGGREKAPAAICRKVIQSKLTGNHEIEIWGDGLQTRSFMYIDDCLTGMDKLWECNYTKPINLGSDEMVSINQLVDIVENIAGLKLKRNYNLNAPQGVRGRNCDNTLIKKELGWAPSIKLEVGLEKTYKWIWDQMNK